MRKPAAADFERPIATVDLVIFSLAEDGLDVLLTRRSRAPFAKAWSLPGGFVHDDDDADVEAAALRVLHDKTGVETPYLEQLQTFGGKTRDPRGWSLSVSYMALIRPETVVPSPGEGTLEVRWWRVGKSGVETPLAFDHREILAAATTRLRTKVEYSTLPAHLLAEHFTLGDLQSVYERILGRPLDKSAFRKRIAEADVVEPVEGMMRRASNRPAQLYRLKQQAAVFFNRLI